MFISVVDLVDSFLSQRGHNDGALFSLLCAIYMHMTHEVVNILSGLALKCDCCLVVMRLFNAHYEVLIGFATCEVQPSYLLLYLLLLDHWIS